MNRSPAAFAIVAALMAHAASPADKFGARPVLTAADKAGLSGSSFAIVETSQTFPRLRNILAKYTIGGAGSGVRPVDSLREAAVEDPVVEIERQLVPLFAKQFDMTLAQEKPFNASPHWEAIAASPTEADYLLYFRTTDLSVAPGSVIKGDYWASAAFRVAVVERKTARPMFVANCYENTEGHPLPARRDDFAANGGKLVNDVALGIAWKCLRKFAEALLPDPAALPETPAEFVDPQGDFMRANPRR